MKKLIIISFSTLLFTSCSSNYADRAEGPRDYYYHSFQWLLDNPDHYLYNQASARPLPKPEAHAIFNYSNRTKIDYIFIILI